MKKSLILKLFEVVCLIAFLLMIVIVLSQILFRYILRISVPWTEEIARVLYIWVIFLGIVQVEAHGVNIRTTYFIDKLPKPICRAILIISNLFSIVLMVCIFIGGIILIRTSSVYTLASLPFISSTIFYVPVLLSAPAVIVFLIKQIKGFYSYIPDTEGKEK